MNFFFKSDDCLYPIHKIEHIDFSEIERLKITIFLEEPVKFTTTITSVIVKDVDCIQFVMDNCPEILEGKRMRWVRYQWVVHNFLGHPIMQLLSFFGMHKLGLRFHHWTVPRPKNVI